MSQTLHRPTLTLRVRFPAVKAAERACAALEALGVPRTQARLDLPESCPACERERAPLTGVDQRIAARARALGAAVGALAGVAGAAVELLGGPVPASHLGPSAPGVVASWGLAGGVLGGALGLGLADRRWRAKGPAHDHLHLAVRVPLPLAGRAAAALARHGGTPEPSPTIVWDPEAPAALAGRAPAAMTARAPAARPAKRVGNWPIGRRWANPPEDW